MELRVLRVGKGRDRLVAELAQRYEARLERYARVIVAHVPEADGSGRGVDEARSIEADRLRAVLDRWDRGRSGASGRSGATIALDERGRTMTSAQLAGEIGRCQERSMPAMTFVLGGHSGLDETFRGEATMVLALSAMTFTHELARALLMEQLYRAHAIRAGHPYHRE